MRKPNWADRVRERYNLPDDAGKFKSKASFHWQYDHAHAYRDIFLRGYFFSVFVSRPKLTRVLINQRQLFPMTFKSPLTFSLVKRADHITRSHDVIPLVRMTQMFQWSFKGNLIHRCLLGHCIRARTERNASAYYADYELARWHKHPFTQPHQLRTVSRTKDGYNI